MSPQEASGAIGVLLPRDIPEPDLVAFAHEADAYAYAYAFDELRVDEDLGYRGGLVQAATSPRECLSSAPATATPTRRCMPEQEPEPTAAAAGPARHPRLCLRLDENPADGGRPASGHRVNQMPGRVPPR
jgi:hypothetical protein